MRAAGRLSRQWLLRLLGADAMAPALRAVGRGLLSIFTLHRFTDPELRIVDTDPATLRDYLSYLRRHRYRLVSLTDVLALLDDGDGATTPAVAFTVDDGYADFARIGAPIFAEYDCPVTLFVPTGFVDGQLWLWWDRVAHVFKHTRHASVAVGPGRDAHRYRWSTPSERSQVEMGVVARLEWIDAPERDAAIDALASQLEVDLPRDAPPEYAPISWEDVRRTARSGVTFGAHTVTHRILSLATDAACDAEVQGSCRRLREQTDAYVPVFCYPNGGRRAVGPRVLAAARRAGVRAALTTEPNYAAGRQVRPPGPVNRLAIPRFPYPEDRGHLVHVVSGLARLRRSPQGQPLEA
jgi:peptidoglycan/xylan/chitin deacetylase (PgdA/CDA1 family)